MSASSEIEQAARQDYGPTTSSENIFDNVSDHKLADTMSIPGIRTPVLRAVPISSCDDPEPDSTNPENHATTSKVDKEVEYHIADKPCDVELSVDTLAGIVRIDEATIDSVGRIAYPLIQEAGGAGALLGVAKLPQNFTINMEGVNVATDAPRGAQLWLPALLAADDPAQAPAPAPAPQPAQLSHIVITSESYSAEPPRRANLVDPNYISRSKPAKVQILSNISLPKTAYSTQYQSKEVSPLYATPNHVYKLNASVVSQKHFNNSVLNSKPPKSQSVGASPAQAPANKVAYTNTYAKGGNTKSLNKVNNGAALGSAAGAQCHILSRVVAGPNKLSVHTGRKVNAFKGNKGTLPNQKQSKAIKIIQQAGSKTEKTWPSASVAYKSPAYNMENSPKVIQKVGSPPHKGHQMNLQKMATKGEQRLILQSPCGPVLLSTAPPRSAPAPAAALRYVVPPAPAPAQVHANQQLTAQILQSLAQPKMMLHSMPAQAPLAPAPPALRLEDHPELKPRYNNQRRIVFGDPSTLLTADDIIGMEERPNLSEELRRYPGQNLALVMLDHTYSQPGQKQPAPPAPAPTPAPIPTPVISPPRMLTPPPAPPPPPPPPEDDAASVLSSIDGAPGPADDRHSGSDTETAPEGEDEGRTRCVCDFTHDDGYMICCDRCGEWQHVDCMGIDRGNIPDAYLCAPCDPRPVDRRHAREIQLRKREELHALARGPDDAPRRRLLTVTTYCDSSGGQLTTYNSLPEPPPPPAPAPPAPPPPKRPPKRLKKPEPRKVKRKLTEKRVKRKKDMLLSRSKYSSAGQPHWQESYESAVTNHYSPELRAKMMKYGAALGGAGAAQAPAQAPAHLCTTVPHAGGKILIATRDLRPGAAVVELRGKYMLAAQHRPPPPARQKPGPFVFFYRLEGIQVCIDTRTYGNEARFVRRSCAPNAELQHCIIKGALHVYLVTIGAVPSNTEITVGHEAANGKQPCACGNPRHCRAGGVVSSRRSEYPSREKRPRNRCTSSSSPPPPTTPLKQYALPVFKSEKKSPKSECDMSPVKTLLSALNFDKIKSELYEPKKEEVQDEPMQPFDLLAREEMKPELDEPDCVPPPEPVVEEKFEPPAPPPAPVVEEKVEIKEPEVEKPEEPIVEPVVEPKIEEKIKDEEIKETIFSDEEKPEVPEVAQSPVKEETKEEEKEISDSKEDEVEKIVREVAVAAKVARDRASRCSRSCQNQDSLDDKTDDSQDVPPTKTKEKDKKKMTREERKMEAIMKAFERMEKAQQRKQEVKERQKRRESDPHPHAAEKEDEDEHCTKKRRKRKGRARTTSQSNRRRLNSADSDMMTSGDEGPCGTSPRRPSITSPRGPGVGSPRGGSGFSPRGPSGTSPRRPPERRDSVNVVLERNEHMTEEIGLSPACLLVEAAVGSVESAFKQPKTKKTMANEWLGRSPERTPSPYQSPYRPPLVPATSLESLVRVASTMIGDLIGQSEHSEDQSPPRTPGKDRSKFPKKFRRVTRSTPPAAALQAPPPAPPQHSAKKRWLRQAISEESEEPAPGHLEPSAMVTPLKKRRLARESVCYETSAVPCNEETSPNLTSEDSPVKEDMPVQRPAKIRSIMDTLYPRDRSRSDSGQGSDDQSHPDHDVLNVNLRIPPDSENIRRIIGVPEPEYGPPEITKIEDIKTLNNNVTELCEESNYNKVEEMDIDTSILPQPQIKEAARSPRRDHSADTSGNSSPQRDEMDDIQKKIHSFHTENIQILRSRNRKPPKEKRKKVNLNFDLNMVDDQISIQLRTEEQSKSPEINGDVHEDSNSVQFISMENIPLPPVETIPLPDPETIPLPAEPPNPVIPPPEAIPLPEDSAKPTIPAIARIASPTSVPIARVESPLMDEDTEPVITTTDKPSILEGSTLPFSSRFSSTGLFSGIFSSMSQNTNESQINENVPGMQIKTVIDRSLDGYGEPSDEMKSVKEILSRVNSMDSNSSSALLSDLLRAGGGAGAGGAGPGAGGAGPGAGGVGPGAGGAGPGVGASPPARRADPRLHPPTVDKPKPVRRKLSISEYRKRLKAPTAEESPGGCAGAGAAGAGAGQWSPGSGAGSLSPLRLEPAGGPGGASAEELEARLHKALATAQKPLDCVFDAQPTASERQREKLSSRLRREFGLALPDEEEAPAPPDLDAGGRGER